MKHGLYPNLSFNSWPSGSINFLISLPVLSNGLIISYCSELASSHFLCRTFFLTHSILFPHALCVCMGGVHIYECKYGGQRSTLDGVPWVQIVIWDTVLIGLELAGLSPQALGIPRDLSVSTESVLGWQALAIVLSPMGAGDDLKSSGLAKQMQYQLSCLPSSRRLPTVLFLLVPYLVC